MSIAPIEPDHERRCFAPCEPGTFCKCLGRVIELRPALGATQAMKTRDIEAGFSPPESHEELVGLSIRDLRLRAGDATHQHYKGGLYRLLGPVFDAETGAPLETRTSRGIPDEAIAYEHVYPHKRQIWIRAKSEFYGTVEEGRDHVGPDVPRFRRLG